MISVIIPVYNDQANLDRCLRALDSQSIPLSDFEVIVVDNNSKPVMVIQKNHSTSISIIVCRKPGSYSARNVGMKAAKGEYLAFLDADCIPDSGWLENGVNAITSGSGRYLAGGDVVFVQSVNPCAVELYQRMTGFGQKNNIQSKSFSATANLFIRSADAALTGEFNEGLLSGGDRDWCWRAKEKGLKLIYAPEALVTTSPRKSLKAAIKQARRIAGGRLWFKNNFPEEIESNQISIVPRRGNLESIYWILSQSELSSFNRTRVLSVAIIIKLAQFFETVRLKLGGHAERE